MRETVRSLRAYFLVVGVLAGIGGINNIHHLLAVPAGLVATWLRMLALLMSGLSLFVAAALIYAGATVRRSLEKGDPRRVQKIVLFVGGVYVLSILANMILELHFIARANPSPYVIGLAVSVALTWYLYTNTRRLAAEAMERRRKELGETFA
jgi:hypothetical protein